MSTIFALSSGSLPAAIAILRMSGPRSSHVLREVSRRKVLKPRLMYHTKIFGEEGEILDSAMAVYLPGPSTFTGEDSAELYLHGSRAVVDSVSGRLSRLEGMRHAEAGEFTKRALLNGKVSSTEVNALGALLHAKTERQLRQATRALQEGDWLQGRLTRIRQKIALVADFGEHVDVDVNEMRDELSSLLEELRERRRKGEAAKRVREGIRIVLAGRPNVGKSTIFNRLCGAEKAIVSPIAGTTRDTLEATRTIGGVPVTVEDTAGVRESEDIVEVEGVKRTMKRIASADVVVGVVDARTAEEEENHIRAIVPEGCEFIPVRNKADLVEKKEDHGDAVFTVATDLNGMEALENKLHSTVISMCPPDAELTLSAGMSEVEVLLEECLSHSDIGLMSEYLQMASSAWGRAHSNEEVINSIMKEFCIGK